MYIARYVRPAFPFCCCRFIGYGKLFFCSVMSFIGFTFLFVCSVFMYRHSPYLDLGNVSDEDFDGMGKSTRGAAYVYYFKYMLFYFIIYI